MTSMVSPAQKAWTTNLLERTFEERRRRTKVIPRFPTEQSCLALGFASLITDSHEWRGIRMTPKILRALDALRREGALHNREQAAAFHEALRLSVLAPKLGLVHHLKLFQLTHDLGVTLRG